MSGHGGQGDPGHELGLLQLHLRLGQPVLQLPLSGGRQEVQAFVEDGQCNLSDLELSVENLQRVELREAKCFQLKASLLNLFYTGGEGAQSAT